MSPSRSTLEVSQKQARTIAAALKMRDNARAMIQQARARVQRAKSALAEIKSDQHRLETGSRSSVQK